ncbi:hypothetical protein SUGI_1190640 [Cryptomeria japonica]|uniref:brassinosteroid-responsive RING protein 1 n=1 Tax=Cryptomeria japonica TaxID=3369 RepID=UPI002414A766|nr:brassinosteroid-responsive RING protein 1 [Cryptomeria japonica]GLJ55448.1 hypothetical protein SUGI_1190640 [Cryptomeria japonica]
MADYWFIRISTGYNGLLVPTFLLNFISVLEDLNKAIWWVLSRVGFLEPGSSSVSEQSSQISVVCGDIIRERLPLLTFGKFAERFSEIEEEVVCAVCLNSFEKDDEIRELCNCSHVFHGNCLDKWIDQRQDTCPLCRCSLLPQRQILDVQPATFWVVDQISYLFAEDLMVSA